MIDHFKEDCQFEGGSYLEQRRFQFDFLALGSCDMGSLEKLRGSLRSAQIRHDFDERGGDLDNHSMSSFSIHFTVVKILGSDLQFGFDVILIACDGSRGPVG